MMRILSSLVLGASLALSGQVWAKDQLLTVRSDQAFATAIEQAQSALKEQGFKVAHVQKCDGGMTGMGYETDNYRVIFFGRLQEVRELTQKYPQLIPLFPFKLAVYAEGDDTIVSVVNPETMKEALQADDALAQQLSDWSKEFAAVLEQVRDERVLASAVR